MVLTSLAPELSGVQNSTPEPIPLGVTTGLTNQLDLKQLPSEGGVLLFKTQPALAAQPVLKSSVPGFLRALLLAAELIGSWFLILLVLRRRREDKRRQRHTPLPVAVVADPGSDTYGTRHAVNLNALVSKHTQRARQTDEMGKDPSEEAPGLESNPEDVREEAAPEPEETKTAEAEAAPEPEETKTAEAEAAPEPEETDAKEAKQRKTERKSVPRSGFKKKTAAVKVSGEDDAAVAAEGKDGETND